VDFSAAGIAKAEQLSQDTDVNWVVADVVSYEPNSTFDLVIVFYLHLVPGEFAEVFTHAVDALVPGGTLFGVGHALRNLEDGYGGPSAPEILWSRELISPLTAGLELVELGERTRFVTDADATAIDFVVHATKPLSSDTV
jgi:SAM-dependent methyltransferase